MDNYPLTEKNLPEMRKVMDKGMEAMNSKKWVAFADKISTKEAITIDGPKYGGHSKELKMYVHR